MLSTRINIPEDLRDRFKAYCLTNNITMTKLLLDGALSVIEGAVLKPKPVEDIMAPAEEKSLKPVKIQQDDKPDMMTWIKSKSKHSGDRVMLAQKYKKLYE